METDKKMETDKQAFLFLFIDESEDKYQVSLLLLFDSATNWIKRSCELNVIIF